MNMVNFRQSALDILKRNDRGEFSIPSIGLYPVQFNWDSAFAALGYRFISPERAFRELELLSEAQWADGMIPHIIFRGNHDGYFPGPDVWQTEQPIPTSGITQPPVLATTLKRLFDTGLTIASNRALKILSAIERWHEWFTKARQDANGAIIIVHPWESGRDNLTDWDSVMQQVIVNHDQGDYKRRDLEHVDSNQRPSKLQYDQYLSIVKAGFDLGWDQVAFGKQSPFRMADPGMTAVLLRAERDLFAMLEAKGLSTAKTSQRIKVLEKGWDSLYNPEIKANVARNSITGELSRAVSAAAFLGPYAGMGSNLGVLMDHFDRIAKAVPYTVPSFDPAHADFNSILYWRGPVWLIYNYMIAQGFSRVGESERAEKIKADSQRLIRLSGFGEYFDSLQGSSLGGKNFTWTASIYLEWLET